MRDGWRDTTLGDIADLTIGRTPPRKEARYWADDLAYPFLSIAEMNGKYADPVTQGVTPAALDEKKAKLVPGGALLMSFKLTIGKVAFATRDMCTNEAIVWIEPHGEHGVTKEYLALALEVADLNVGENRAVKGATLNRGSLEAIQIPVPPLGVQRRIVDLIDHIDRTVDAADSHVAQIADALSSLRDSLMADCEVARLGNLLLRLDGGQSVAGSDELPMAGEAGILKLNAIQPGRFDSGAVKRLPESATLPDKNLVHLDDVLITRSNTPERVGYTCHVDATPPRSTYIPDLVFRLVPDSEKMLPAFLAEAMCTSTVRAQVMGSASGTSASMRKINKTKVRSYSVPAPPLEEQRRVISTVDAARSVVTRAEGEQERLTQVRNRILQSLLSGEHEIPDSYDRFLEVSDGQAA